MDDKDIKFSDNKKGVYQENKSIVVILVIACIVPIIGFILACIGFGRAYRIGVGVKYGVLAVVFGFLNFLLFTFLFYLWLNNGGKF